MLKNIFTLLTLLIAAFAQAQTDSPFITTSDSVKLFVKRAGKGMPVLFIHGGPGSNSDYFEYTGGNVFEKDVQMIYLDQHGCGKSDNDPKKDYSLKRVVKDFEEVRQALGINRWVLMPLSFGGILATEYAYQHPSVVKAMTYLNCTIDISHSAKSGISKTIELLPSLKQNEVAYLLNDSVKLMDRFFNSFWHLDQAGIRYKLFFDKKENDSLHSAITVNAAKHWDMGQNVWNFPEYFVSFSAKTASIAVPVLIIGGTRDFTIGVDHPKLMQFRTKEVKYIAGGHALYMEHNAELYDAVVPFLSNHVSKS
ncbi:proline iminopeptidase [Cnuella takakiae]|uniref:Proline iminopeptidase n=1 Tax=Cnuella takakiae TaxID=1302690 RepID=A0A1M4ZBU4_9BACT|nr:alpha/beta hydrolase [Cnuella takakiae]OLY94260.1 hypothetical protein BUE76_22015 [Cnuella takakiae]SHF15494.1 proline iminopeptidase [Cnuella takakiae]